MLHTEHVLFTLGRCILRPFRDMFRYILSSVYMVKVRVCTLFTLSPSPMSSLLCAYHRVRCRARRCLSCYCRSCCPRCLRCRCCWWCCWYCCRCACGCGWWRRLLCWSVCGHGILRLVQEVGCRKAVVWLYAMCYYCDGCRIAAMLLMMVLVVQIENQHLQD